MGGDGIAMGTNERTAKLWRDVPHTILPSGRTVPLRTCKGEGCGAPLAPKEVSDEDLPEGWRRLCAAGMCSTCHMRSRRNASLERPDPEPWRIKDGDDMKTRLNRDALAGFLRRHGRL